MRFLLSAALGCASLLTGCSLLGHLGYYKYEKPEQAPPEEASQVVFPNSLSGGVELTGPMMAALKVAMSDFRPPAVRPESEESPEGKCLARWDVMHTTVYQAGDDLFFVRFSPDLTDCGPGFVVLDAGAVYAINGKGRILAKE